MPRRASRKPRSSSPRRVMAWIAGLASLVFVALVILGFTRLESSNPRTVSTNANLAVNNEAVQVEQASASNLLQVVESDTTLSGDDKVSALVNGGTAFLREGQPAQAVVMYEAALKVNAEDEDIHFNL